MLIDQRVEVKITTKNAQHFQKLGYEPEYHVDKGGVKRLKRTPILVNAKDLPKGSYVIVDVICDNCGKVIKKTYKEVARCENDACDIKCTGQLREKQELLKFKERIGKDPRDFLYQRYVNEKATVRQLAVEIYGNKKCTASVCGWLKKFNIPTRHGSEAVKVQWIDNEERRELSRGLAKTHLLSEESVKKAREAQNTPEYRKGASERKKGENNPMATHNKTHTRLYRIWSGMKKRCYRIKNADYDNYGGRGIRICREWLSDFQNFYDWATANGYSDNLSIDRINNDGDYEPSNCRWATAKEQRNNQRPR